MTMSIDGTNGITFPNGSVQTVAGAAALTRFVSTAQTWTASSVLTLAHGLGVVPAFITYKLVCLTAENGYSVGDVVYINPMWNRADASPVGFTPRLDSTNIYVAFNSTSSHALMPKTGGGIVNTTLAYWSLNIVATA